MSKVKVGIINVTGYAGSELARILYNHPGVQLTTVTGRGAVGQKLGDIFPHLSDFNLEIKAEPDEADLLFSALPHKASAEAIIPQLKKGIKVIDISADFRLKNHEDYPRWYDFQHPAPELLQEAVYGLPELKREEVKKSRLVANPGCYPTSAILALAPAVKHGLISPDIIIDSKSGVSGAGRTLAMNVHFSEANENVSAYSLGGHRHLPEISQEVAMLSPGFEPKITFIPHLIPMTRGILSTCYAILKGNKISPDEKGQKEIRQLYQEFYKGERFVRVTESPPQTKQTSGSNLCLLYPVLDIRTGRLIVISCLDNLVKGAAGEAVQNMNLMLGFPEHTGLDNLALYP